MAWGLVAMDWGEDREEGGGGTVGERKESILGI